MLSRLTNLIGTFSKSSTVDTAATLSMRLARPIFFFLMTIMLVVGWFESDHLKAYFEAMAAAPQWLTDIMTIFIVGLAGEKGFRAIEAVWRARADSKSDGGTDG